MSGLFMRDGEELSFVNGFPHKVLDSTTSPDSDKRRSPADQSLPQFLLQDNTFAINLNSHQFHLPFSNPRVFASRQDGRQEEAQSSRRRGAARTTVVLLL
jgi:hypothetical protein